MCWRPEYVILIVASTLVDYIAGIKMHQTQVKARRRKYLILSLLLNLGLLFSFKYFNFFNDSLRIILTRYNIFYNIPNLKVLLPIGISFYTFQTLSYTIDVYRGKRDPERHLGIFALYVAFFPQLVAGPIERSTRLLPQFRKQHTFDYKRVTNGLKLMAWGYFQKVVIADNLAVGVDNIYNNPHGYSGLVLIVATVFFAFQIYCDFSGYTDIARGAAQIMGYDLMLNFRRPYFAKSIRDFWQRWHISLTSWFRDYFYIPLGGNRVVKWRWYYNIFIVFLVSGLWHGANWTFIIWGALHGFYLLFSIWTKDIRERLAGFTRIREFPTPRKYLRALVTFCLVLFAWVFFRANSVSDALYIVTNVHTGWGDLSMVSAIKNSLRALGLTKLELFIAVISIAILVVIHLIQRKGSLREMIAVRPAWFRWLAYYALLLSIVFFGAFNRSVPFVYFQF